MKINPRHIKKFEAFIQEGKDPNAKNTEQPKNDKKSASADEDEETQNDSEDEDDIVEEMKRYFAEKEKKQPHLWKSTI